MADAPEDEVENRNAEGDVSRPPLGLRRRGIYLLPNLFTTGVLFCGFFAMVQAMNGRFDIGCIAIFIAMVLDGYIWALVDFGLAPREYFWLTPLTWVVAVFAGVTMVSNVPFWSFKEVNWKKRVPLWVILASVLALSIVASRPSLVLFILVM